MKINTPSINTLQANSVLHSFDYKIVIVKQSYFNALFVIFALCINHLSIKKTNGSDKIQGKVPDTQRM